jgi:GntR family negative regulator for fad regulon and positive regulator of fabA
MTTYQKSENDWQPISKPAEIAETRLLEAILSGRFPIQSKLPAERDLAAQIGVTRPTLREALQRLGRDGWLDIQHGKPTRVRDYWSEGNLGILARLAQLPAYQPPGFVDQLLEVRLLLAPEYTRQAVERSPDEVATFLLRSWALEESSARFASFDWELHVCLTQLAASVVYRLLLNSFHNLYLMLGEHYFNFDECRQRSRIYYAALLECAKQKDAPAAESLTRQAMLESRKLWNRLQISEVSSETLEWLG